MLRSPNIVLTLTYLNKSHKFATAPFPRLVSTSFAVSVISNTEFSAVSVTIVTAQLSKQTLPTCGKQAVNCLTSLCCFHCRQQNVRSAF